MAIELTDEQIQLVKDAVHWFKYESDQVFQYSAPAGAGKTTVMHYIIDQLGLDYEEVAPMAYTGAASIVMRINGFPYAKTIHSWMYTVQEKTKAVNGKIVKEISFVRKPLPEEIKLICIDEGAMVPKEMADEIESRNVKILVCGDINQLPPVNSDPSYLTDKRSEKIHYLTQIMRQEKGSSIVELANMILNDQKFRLGNYGDAWVITTSMLTDQMMKEADAILCSTNRTRDKLTDHIRHDIFGLKSKMPMNGEKLVCRQNNWAIDCDGLNLANGMSGIATRGFSVDRYADGKFEIDFTPTMFPHITFKDLECDYKFFVSNYEERRYMKSFSGVRRGFNDFGEKFEFGYALTTHLAQGSQYRRGIYIQEPLRDTDLKKLFYTAITRFREKCIYVVPAPRLLVNIPMDIANLKKAVVSSYGVPVI